MLKYKILILLIMISGLVYTNTPASTTRLESGWAAGGNELTLTLPGTAGYIDFRTEHGFGVVGTEAGCSGDEPCEPPLVISTRPTHDGVPIDVPLYWITVEFDQEMHPGSFDFSRFVLQSPQGELIPGTVMVEGNAATFVPSTSLQYETTYQVTVKGGPGGVRSAAGLTLSSDISWSFTTESLQDMGPLVYHSYRIDDDDAGGSDGNADRNIDPGETIELSVFLGNAGESTASEIIGIITSSDPSLQFTSNTESDYDNIIGWGTELNQDDFEFSVAQDVDCGQMLPFNLSLSAAGGYSAIVPFTIPVSCSPPDAANIPLPALGAAGIPLNPTLRVHVSDPDGDALSVTFYGREINPAVEGDFEVVTLPDTQYYTCDGNFLSCPYTPLSPYANDGQIDTFYAQVQWVVDNQDSIAYVPHVGDLVQNADWFEEEWVRASSAMQILETGAPGVPYGIAFGNHDLRNLYGANSSVTGDTFINQYFGNDRFFSNPYYGGHFSFNNNNHYVLFEIENMAFIGIHLEYDRDYDEAVLSWADDLLKQYPDRRGIVSRHAMIDEAGNYVSNGERVFEALADNPNLFLFLCGHIDGEYIRTDEYNGRTIFTVLSDYQGEPNGGDGWLRRLKFSPAGDLITVRSYTPLYDLWDWDDPRATGEVDLVYDMGYTTSLVASISGVPSGSVVTAPWENLQTGNRYEWYVSVSDGTNTTISPLWHFTTANQPLACYPLTLGFTGSGGLPDTLPINSYACADGEFVPGESITLVASPADGFHVGAWTGTVDDASKNQTNQLIMPGGPHQVTVHYAGSFSSYLPLINRNGN